MKKIKSFGLFLGIFLVVYAFVGRGISDDITIDGQSAALREIEVVQDHNHNRERWFGKSADQSGNDWALATTLTMFRAISGDDVFGADPNDEAKIFGSDDTPAIAGMTLFDVHRIMVSATSNANDTVLRMIYGTGTMADAQSAGQYSDVMVTEARKGSPIPIMMPRLPAGMQVWIRMLNATDNATIDFFIGIHEYER